MRVTLVVLKWSFIKEHIFILKCRFSVSSGKTFLFGVQLSFLKIQFSILSLLTPRELLKAMGYIWPYIPSRVLIRAVYHLNNQYAHYSLINIIGIYSVYPLVYCEIYPSLGGNIERVKSQYSIFYNDILFYQSQRWVQKSQFSQMLSPHFNIPW